MKEKQMLSVDEALQSVLEATRRLDGVSVPTLDSAGLVLDEDVAAREAIPPFDQSAMDGYAVRAADLAMVSKDQPVILNVTDRIRAGVISRKVLSGGEAIQVMTGAAMPGGADAVVMVEQTERIGEDRVKIHSSVAPHENVRFAGEDIQKGQTVFETGRVLKPYDIGVLASIGTTAVRAIPRPTVAILSTGDELLGVHESLTPGKIRTSNNFTLHALLRQYGADPIDLGIARDTPEDTEEKLRAALSADIILTSGGVSMGTYDYVRNVLEKLGVEIKFWKVKQKPGKPMVFGVKDHKLFFGLPGNPVSTGVCFELYVVPAIYKMSGRPYRPVRAAAQTEHAIPKKPGLRHFLRGILKKTAKGYSVRSTGNQSSGVMTSLAYAHGLIDIPEEKENVQSGETVDVIVLDKDILF